MLTWKEPEQCWILPNTETLQWGGAWTKRLIPTNESVFQRYKSSPGQNQWKQESMELCSLKFAKCNGLPLSFYELVQQLGRVNRKVNAEPGSNTYEVHIDFYSYVSLFLRTMKLDCKKERKIQITQLHKVLELSTYLSCQRNVTT